MTCLKYKSSEAIEFLHLRHAFTRCWPSLLLSILPLAYSPSITKKSMREVSGAPCPSPVAPNLLPRLGKTRLTFGIRWHLLLFHILPVGTEVYMQPHTSKQIQRTRVWTHTLLPPQKPPAPIEWVQDGCWLRKSSLLHSISLSSVNIWSKRNLCSYLRDSWVRLACAQEL